MKEGASHLERYQSMSPQECNAEMKGLFDLLPSFEATFGQYASDGPDRLNHMHEIAEHIDKRKNSKFSKDLISRLNSLLSFAQITTSFKSNILSNFAMLLELGEMKKIESEDNSVSRDLFQWDDTSSGGIFDKERAKGIEAEAYNEEVEIQLMGQDLDEVWDEVQADGVFQELAREVNSMVEENKLKKLVASDEELRDIEKKEKKVKESVKGGRKKRLRGKRRSERWRGEFIERYGDEP